MASRAPARAPTRADVALLACTSTAVVSYVINDGPRPVAPATRARVEQAIQQLGYRPDRIARALAARRSETIGLVVPDITNPFMSGIIQAVEAAATLRGFTVLLANSSVDELKERTVIRNLIDSRVDGILLVAVGPRPDVIDELNQRRMTVVVLDRPVPGLNAASVLVDNRGGAREATVHLAGHGHRRIACITGPSALSTAAERERGWAEAMTQLDSSRKGCPVVRTRVDRRAGYEAALELLRRVRPVTGLFVATDEQALGVLRAAADLGRRVPEDLAIVSFDGISEGEFSVPGLTTMSQPVDSMAARAIASLVAGRRTRSVLPLELIRRGSCGCPDAPSRRAAAH